jgi:pimeloyl-ACP methyl ester carboxylesterase
MAERMIEADGVRLCTESFGDTADPPVLLIMGTAASMVSWEDGFCEALAGGGRFVVRYDHRDTGRSATDEPGSPGYGGPDLVADAARVLDAYGIGAAHVVGLSMGGALAQLLALDFPDRVASLVLISASPAGSADDLPPATDAYTAFIATGEVDWSDPGSVVEHVVAEWRALGGRRPFDEAAARALAARDVARADRVASAQNHALLSGGGPWRHRLGSLAAPTLVVHGTADPLFPLGHGEALAAEIPGARLLRLDGAGHGLERADWDTVARAILAHTEAAPGAARLSGC